MIVRRDHFVVRDDQEIRRDDQENGPHDQENGPHDHLVVPHDHVVRRNHGVVRRNHDVYVREDQSAGSIEAEVVVLAPVGPASEDDIAEVLREVERPPARDEPHRARGGAGGSSEREGVVAQEDLVDDDEGDLVGSDALVAVVAEENEGGAEVRPRQCARRA